MRTRILVSRTQVPGQEGFQYHLVDYNRRSPLVVLGVLFALFVVALSRWYGLFSLLGAVALIAGSAPRPCAQIGCRGGCLAQSRTLPRPSRSLTFSTP